MNLKKAKKKLIENLMQLELDIEKREKELKDEEDFLLLRKKRLQDIRKKFNKIKKESENVGM
jgi:hypothetical protein